MAEATEFIFFDVPEEKRFKASDRLNLAGEAFVADVVAAMEELRLKEVEEKCQQENQNSMDESEILLLSHGTMPMQTPKQK